VLKSGCAIEKLQERDMEKTKTLILMYSVIAVFIRRRLFNTPELAPAKRRQTERSV
jgi:hypothetical protein